MGHPNASITLNVYGWLYPDEREQAAADMGKWLSMECIVVFFVERNPYPHSGHTVVIPYKRVSDLHL